MLTEGVQASYDWMSALSLWQPWATLIALEIKLIETRSWSKGIAGARSGEPFTFAIHASKRHMTQDEVCMLHDCDVIADALKQALGRRWTTDDFSLGCIVATAERYDCKHTGTGGSGQGIAPWVEDLSELERACGNFDPDRYGHFLRNIRRLATPIPWIGRQGYFPVKIPADTKFIEAA